jgi:hypothetical protein
MQRQNSSFDAVFKICQEDNKLRLRIHKEWARKNAIVYNLKKYQ